jgi:tetraacyldisaccharide 4'-kinase
MAIATRNAFYDRGIFKSHKLLRPVISVGNISVGGSGKTPFVILLGELLKQGGIEFDVLSRGYGRATRGALRVDPNGTSRDFGDEPLLIARGLGCPVFVGESRYEAGKLPESQRPGPQLHILDDGFQHRSLARNFDIVLLTPQDLRDQLLPVGRLREPLSSLRRADAIAVDENFDVRQLPCEKVVLRLRRGLAMPENLSFQNPIVFCGIARPERFVEQLQAMGIRPAAKKFYRDHHRYTSDDVRELLEMKARHGADGFIATQKDWINLGQNYARLAPIAFPPVKMELVDAADALDTILRVITDRAGKA